MMRAVAMILVGFGASAAYAQMPLKRTIDFEKDVRPILVDRCYECHGPDKRKAELRLDRKADALRGSENGPVIVPRKSADSPLVQRISSSDKNERMPPKEKPPLTPAQIAVLRAWVDQGASWPDYPAVATDKLHWAYQPLVRSSVPKITSRQSAIINPIDAFIQAKLKERSLAPSAPADKRTWLRRVTFDLIGLPPTPEEWREFLADDSREAYEKVVDRLLASPHYGERWARHWIDVAHFAESHGNDQDRPRPNAWPYRDYLIRSFNTDKPYSRFVAEQVAGDVIFPDDPWATVGLGFLAAGPWDESSLRDINPDTVDNKIARMLDRDDILTTVMTTFVSSTVNCARCHAHKFDPISQQDYYALQAVFAGVDRAERPFDSDAATFVKRRHLLARLKAIERGLPVAELLSKEAQDRAAAWEKTARQHHAAWNLLEPVAFVSARGTTFVKQPDGSLLCTGKAPETDTYAISLAAKQSAITAVRLEVMSDPSLPMKGPGRQDNGNLHLSEFRLLLWPGFGSPPIPIPIKRAAADFNQQGWIIDHALDGNVKTAWGIFPEVGRTHSAVFELARPLTLPRGATLTAMLVQQHGGHHLIGRPRLSSTDATNPTQVRPLPDAVAKLLAAPADKRTPKQRAELAKFVCQLQLEDELAALPPPQLVYAAAHDFKPDGNFKPTPRPHEIHVLRRGDIHSPLEAMGPGTLACVAGLPSRFTPTNPEDEGERRAALARWLVDPHNVLTWRSIVNRVWHYHFGRGIVDTPNDFGRMGSAPTHPALLDWLAVEFRDSGGSFKKLHKLIVLSEVYRQSSRHNEACATLDGDNRNLWRMNRERLDAESIHDAVLVISGRLDRTMGGPSVKQFIQTPGIHVTPNVDYANFNVDDPALNRRSIYRFLFRTLPDPFMEALDHPDGSQQAPVRSISITAPQALAMLNNKFMVRQCEHLAELLKREASDPKEQIRRLYELALLREPKAQEVELLANHANRFGMASVCRIVLNSNEFVFVP
jgi:Protein of unknown function (DUF1553)/Protein of unknown function (DUF1549)/Planctomycete cytochrome C